ncbi:MAG: orotidine-5'-phosphate decarboxylase [Polyangia bacterium]
MSAQAKLAHNLAQRGPLCIGLDPDLKWIPSQLCGDVTTFLLQIIAATSDLACGYKINTAFFESLGSSGTRILETVRAAIPEDCFLIWDAKRGDIENTNRHYAHSAFKVWNADAVTVSPYLGFDALRPFLDYQHRLTFVLCATSAGTELQELTVGENQIPIWQWVAQEAVHRSRGQLGLVVGATHAERLHCVRQIAPQLPLLVPGVGAQGGAIPSQPAIVNVSRSILFASCDADFAMSARRAAQSFRSRLLPDASTHEVGSLS